MKIKLLLFTWFISIASMASAAKFTFSIGSSVYSPTNVSVTIGDTIVIPANSSHPTMQVSAADWYASNNTLLAGGFGPLSGDTSIIISTTDTIFFMCNFHGPSGMKAFIAVKLTSAFPNFNVDLFPVFANPALHNLTINNSGITLYALAIYDFSGKYYGEYVLEFGLNSIALNPGNYLLLFRNNEGVLEKKTLLVLRE